MRTSITGGHIIDPATGLDELSDLHIADGVIASIGPAQDFHADEIIEANGHIVCPGLVDLCARIREPGQENKATIATESAAAAAGGITTVCCPPDTAPVVDTPAVVELIHQRATTSGQARIEVFGALTRGLAGQQLAEMGALKKAGCSAVGNGLNPVSDTEVMRRAMEYACTFDLPVLVFAEDPWLSQGRVVHDGEVSTRLGLPGVPEMAETIIVARDLLLAEQTGARAHFCRLSSGPAVEMIRDARAHGLPVTADVAIHQLHLTEANILGFNSQCHVRPPLRTARDRQMLRDGVADGTITAICSDHQPHELDAKLHPFPLTEPGISGLDTLLSLTLQLVSEGAISMFDAIARLTCGPAAIINRPYGTIKPGAMADVCIFAATAKRHFTVDDMISQGKNTPFAGTTLNGLVMRTLFAGRTTFQRPPA